MRVGQTGPRMMSVQVSPSQQLHAPPVGLPTGPRMGVAAPPPPPPPYPGPPPPYPGSATPQHQPQQVIFVCFFFRVHVICFHFYLGLSLSINMLIMDRLLVTMRFL